MGEITGPTGTTHTAILSPKPVLLLPGIMGSRCNLFGYSAFAKRIFEKVASSANPLLGVIHGLVRAARNSNLREDPATFDDVWFFDALVEMLKNAGHAIATVPYQSEGPRGYGEWRIPEKSNSTAFILPYDWRQSIATPATALAKTLDSLHEKLPVKMPFTIVAHSMGGLVARYMIEAPELGVSLKLVDTLITVGTPHHGSIDALGVILGLTSKDPLREATHGVVPLFPDQIVERDIALAWDSFLQLVPTRAVANRPGSTTPTLTPIDLLQGLCWRGHPVMSPALPRLQSPSVTKVTTVLHAIKSPRTGALRYDFLSEIGSNTAYGVNIGKSYVVQEWPLNAEPEIRDSAAQPPVRTVFDANTLSIYWGRGDGTVPDWSSEGGPDGEVMKITTGVSHPSLMDNDFTVRNIAEALTHRLRDYQDAYWTGIDNYLHMCRVPKP